MGGPVPKGVRSGSRRRWREAPSQLRSHAGERCGEAKPAPRHACVVRPKSLERDVLFVARDGGILYNPLGRDPDSRTLVNPVKVTPVKGPLRILSGVQIRMSVNRVLLVVVALMIACGLGCSDPTGVHPPAASNPDAMGGSPPQPSADFAARLSAAQDISSDLARVEALVSVAKDAARAGDGEVAKRAIEAIDANNLARDNTAVAAAAMLSQAGRLEDAVAVAKLIGSDLARDQTLARLAKGK